MTSVDAVLLLSFGGPEATDQVRPFLEQVTRGRGIPPQRLAEVEKQYQTFGGVSPINEQNGKLRAALAQATGLRVYLGNRNWHPFVADTLRQMRADGVRSAAVVVTSGYSSYSGCRQYRENLFDAVTDAEADGQGRAPSLIKVRRWFDNPAFIEVMSDNVLAAIGPSGEAEGLERPHLVFTAHSIPLRQNESSGPPGEPHNTYQNQHEFAAGEVARRISEELGYELPWDLVFQSRSGPPSIPWLVPDVSDHLRTLHERGARSVVLVPIGFISDHMEVMWDLDTVAMRTARELGLQCARAATAGTDPRFVAALASLVAERVEEVPMGLRPALAPWGPAPDLCPAGCCPNLAGPRPALCGQGGPDD